MNQLYKQELQPDSCSRLMMEIQNGAELCFPHLSNSSCKKPTLPWTEAVLLNTVLFFICLIAAALNLLVIISVSHFRQRPPKTNTTFIHSFQFYRMMLNNTSVYPFRQLHKPTNILLLSLAVSDFLVCFLMIPVEIFRNTACWLFGDLLCILYFYVACVVLCASIGNIVFISIDRYIAICDPLHYPNKITLVRVKCCVCLCWLWNVFYVILILKEELIQPGRRNSCIGECEISLNYIAGTVDLMLNFIFPVTIIIVLYLRVFVVAVSQARAMRSHITAVTLQLSVNVKTKKSELKAARTLGVLVIVFLTCYCPYYCYSVIESDLTSTPYASLLFFLFYFNSCLNPVIYALFYPWFRKAVKLIVTLQILERGSCEANIL